MNTSTIVMLVILAVLVVLYIGRRRARLTREDRD
jgi:hypothetical protein